jgi:carboxypeptidase family protein/TonB-dependent receptor-like protein
LTLSHRYRGVALIASALFAPAALLARDDGGGLLGWVENSQGAPVPGAVVSVFGKGIRGGSLVTLSDSTGRFSLPSLPAGSYTLRALGQGHLPAPAQTVTVLPRQDAVFTVSLKPEPDGEREATLEPTEPDTLDTYDARREFKWLLRHKRRSVLESRDDGPNVAADEDVLVEDASLLRPDLNDRATSFLPALAGTFEVVATPSAIGEDGAASTADGLPTSQGVLRLKGKLADFGEWSLGGLVTESQDTTWRMAAEFVLMPGTDHEIQTGAGYGTRYLHAASADVNAVPLDERSVGAIFARDRWHATDRLVATAGVRYSFVGFVEDRNSLDAFGGLEHQVGRTGHLRGTFATRTLAPGGDLLTLSTLAAAPVLTLARLDNALRSERSTRYELGFDQSLGATTLGTFIFQEGVRDQLINIHRPDHSLRIVNGGELSVRGMGLTMARSIGPVRGSLEYTYGQALRSGPSIVRVLASDELAEAFGRASYHDVVARVETLIDLTDTRLTAYYRVNTMNRSDDPLGSGVLTHTRFHVQLNQGLPFLQTLTRADWELLVAVRNLFYEEGDAGALDELAVVRAPKRVMGGFAVRF